MLRQTTWTRVLQFHKMELQEHKPVFSVKILFRAVLCNDIVKTMLNITFIGCVTAPSLNNLLIWIFKLTRTCSLFFHQRHKNLSPQKLNSSRKLFPGHHTTHRMTSSRNLVLSLMPRIELQIFKTRLIPHSSPCAL